jgi:hypothetical protein
VLLNELSIGVAVIILEEHNSSEVIEGSENVWTVVVNSLEETVIRADTHVEVVEAPVLVVIVDLLELASVSVLEEEINGAGGNIISLIDGDAHWVFLGLHGGVENFVHGWDHPLSHALIGDEVGLGVVGSLDNGFPSALGNLSHEFSILHSGLISDGAFVNSDKVFGGSETEKGSVCKSVHICCFKIKL